MVSRQKAVVGRQKPWTGIILGEAASKANSRRHIVRHGKSMFIKSAKALRYVQDFAAQCPLLDPMFEGDVMVELDMFYATRRSDLDESLVLDCLQGRIYRNDRQVKSKIVHWHLDRGNPRVTIRVSPVESVSGSGDT